MAPGHRDDDDGNNHVSFIVYMDERFKAHNALHEEQARSVLAAVSSLNERLAQMNEFRASLNALTNSMVERGYYERNHTELDKRIQVLERQSATKAALESQNNEVQRMRRNLFYTVIGGLCLIMADIVLAAFKR
jgi:DNA-binding MarR family transcriptional regulator